MKITVNIEDDKLGFFLELLNHFDFIEIESVQNFELSDKHKDILDKRLEGFEDDSNDAISWEKFKEEMNDKLK